jgi:hypothetical protein
MLLDPLGFLGRKPRQLPFEKALRAGGALKLADFRGGTHHEIPIDTNFADAVGQSTDAIKLRRLKTAAVTVRGKNGVVATPSELLRPSEKGIPTPELDGHAIATGARFRLELRQMPQDHTEHELSPLIVALPHGHVVHAEERFAPTLPKYHRFQLGQ